MIKISGKLELKKKYQGIKKEQTLKINSISRDEIFMAFTQLKMK